MNYKEAMTEFTFRASNELFTAIEKMKGRIFIYNKRWGERVVNSVTRKAVGGLTLTVEEIIMKTRNETAIMSDEARESACAKALEDIKEICDRSVEEYEVPAEEVLA